MITIGQLIDKYKELDAFVETEDTAHSERMKPYREAIATIKNAALSELQRTGQQNAKSENGGTAYQQTIMSVKVDNSSAFLDFVAKNNRWDMLSPQALKEPVKEFVETNKAEPPGLKVEFITKCNIRTS